MKIIIINKRNLVCVFHSSFVDYYLSNIHLSMTHSLVYMHISQFIYQISIIKVEKKRIRQKVKCSTVHDKWKRKSLLRWPPSSSHSMVIRHRASPTAPRLALYNYFYEQRGITILFPVGICIYWQRKHGIHKPIFKQMNPIYPNIYQI